MLEFLRQILAPCVYSFRLHAPQDGESLRLEAEPLPSEHLQNSIVFLLMHRNLFPCTFHSLGP